MNQSTQVILARFDEYRSLTSTHRDIITSLLHQIPKMFSHMKKPEPALLPALNAAMSALQATGGKIFASICSLPTWGPGALHMRDDPKVHGTDAERKLFTTDNQAWRTTAGKMAEHGIGVDMFVAAPGGTYIDVATIGRSSAFLLPLNLWMLMLSRPCR